MVRCVRIISFRVPTRVFTKQPGPCDKREMFRMLGRDYGASRGARRRWRGGGRREGIGASPGVAAVPLAGGRGAIRRAVWGYVCLVIMNMI